MAKPRGKAPSVPRVASKVRAANKFRRSHRSYASYVKELESKEKVTVRCPYGHGLYHIKLHGSKWYGTPEIVFEASPKCPPPYNNPRAMQAGRFRTNQGRCIPWYPTWQHRRFYSYSDYGGVDPKEKDELLKQMGRMIIGYILAGRRLYLLKCGQRISSLNDDTKIGLSLREIEDEEDYGDNENEDDEYDRDDAG